MDASPATTFPGCIRRSRVVKFALTFLGAVTTHVLRVSHSRITQTDGFSSE